MLSLQAGYSFTNGEKVTPAKLHALIDSAAITGLSASHFANSSTCQILYYGPTAPSPYLGRLWYDTTPGSEGLKYAFVSPSNASISAWLYRTPRLECMCLLASSAVSQGATLFIPHTLVGQPSTAVYDGLVLPLVEQVANATFPGSAYFVAAESAQGLGSAVKCIAMGPAPNTVFGNTVTNLQGALFTYGSGLLASNNYKQNRESALGLIVNGGDGSVARATVHFFGTPAYEYT